MGFFLDPWPLRKGAIGCPETSVSVFCRFYNLEDGIEMSRNVGKDSFSILDP